MTNKIDAADNQTSNKPFESESATMTSDSGKKEFVEPELSTPVSVLEAITFFQGVTSGDTGKN